MRILTVATLVATVAVSQGFFLKFFKHHHSRPSYYADDFDYGKGYGYGHGGPSYGPSYGYGHHGGHGGGGYQGGFGGGLHGGKGFLKGALDFNLGKIVSHFKKGHGGGYGYGSRPVYGHPVRVHSGRYGPPPPVYKAPVTPAYKAPVVTYGVPSKGYRALGHSHGGHGGQGGHVAIGGHGGIKGHISGGYQAPAAQIAVGGGGYTSVGHSSVGHSSVGYATGGHRGGGHSHGAGSGSGSIYRAPVTVQEVSRPSHAQGYQQPRHSGGAVVTQQLGPVKEVTFASSAYVAPPPQTHQQITQPVRVAPIPAPVAPAPQPQYVPPAPQPQHVAPAPQPQYVAPAPQPQYVAQAPQPQYVAPAPQPEYVAPVPVSSYVPPTSSHGSSQATVDPGVAIVVTESQSVSLPPSSSLLLPTAGDITTPANEYGPPSDSPAPAHGVNDAIDPVFVRSNLPPTGPDGAPLIGDVGVADYQQ